MDVFIKRKLVVFAAGLLAAFGLMVNLSKRPDREIWQLRVRREEAAQTLKIIIGLMAFDILISTFYLSGIRSHVLVVLNWLTPVAIFSFFLSMVIYWVAAPTRSPKVFD